MKRKWWLVIPWLLVCSCKKPEVATAAGAPESARKDSGVVQASAPTGTDSEEAAVNERTRPSQRPEPKVYAKPKPEEYPPAVTVAGKPGYVTSPYNGKIIDVRGLPPGTLVADPTFPTDEKKYFRTPPE
jgi:hypothetical protein